MLKEILFAYPNMLMEKYIGHIFKCGVIIYCEETDMTDGGGIFCNIIADNYLVTDTHASIPVVDS